MQQHILSVGSVTYAIKGRDILRKSGIKAYIERKTNAVGGVGCGYVIVATGDRHGIIKKLNEFNIKITEISSR